LHFDSCTTMHHALFYSINFGHFLIAGLILEKMQVNCQVQDTIMRGTVEDHWQHIPFQVVSSNTSIYYPEKRVVI
jgi:hypothetical protein